MSVIKNNLDLSRHENDGTVVQILVDESYAHEQEASAILVAVYMKDHPRVGGGFGAWATTAGDVLTTTKFEKILNESGVDFTWQVFK